MEGERSLPSSYNPGKMHLCPDLFKRHHVHTGFKRKRIKPELDDSTEFTDSLQISFKKTKRLKHGWARNSYYYWWGEKKGKSAFNFSWRHWPLYYLVTLSGLCWIKQKTKQKQNLKPPTQPAKVLASSAWLFHRAVVTHDERSESSG